ncbi:MAG: DHA2 family efflux MFS transporter permease subunit [Bacteroidota bacterium]|nr:DHA2 family efflux MFS transporter permease subunit [Bacteroidota bacterium]MDP4231644.1 DHA2 family efflux MFS transporter permease subunit [Bacteroidota bacterium]MDP4237425.1 DHA2 family efflux MFS transporter permease subunit [Bacteroidota bacterium]
MAERGAMKWIITITVIIAATLELVDSTIVNVSLPQIMGNLGASLEDIGWLVTSYAVANVIILPMSGWLGMRFGRKRYFLASIIIFTIASFFCGTAHSLSELIGYRIVQGLAGGGLLSTCQAILLETWPREEIGMATALFGLGAIVGPTIGPTIGGYITDHLSWPWIFYVNIPVGIIAAVFAFMFVKEYRHPLRIPVDWIGIILLVITVGCLQIFLEKGNGEDWFSTTYIAVLAFVVLITGILFVWRELSTEHPVVNFKILRHRSFSLGIVTSFAFGFGLFTSFFVLPIFCQNLLGFSAQQTGIMIMWGGIATIVLLPFVGMALKRGIPAQLICLGGMIFFLIFTQMVSGLTLSAGIDDFIIPILIRGVGLSLLFVPITTLALQDVPPEEMGQATGLNNMMRQLGGSLGIAIITTIISSRLSMHRAHLVEHISPYSPHFNERFNASVQSLVAKGHSFVEAKQLALQAINGSIVKQTMLLTYTDAFWIGGIIFMVAIPFIFMQRFKRRVKVAVEAH